MHELGLATEILDLIEAARRRDGFRWVAQLRLEAGTLSGVDADALRFALDTVKIGTCLEPAAIDIVQPVGSAWCSRCATTVEIRNRTDACPVCDGYFLQVTGGTELRVMDLVVREEEPAPCA